MKMKKSPESASSRCARRPHYRSLVACAVALALNGGVHSTWAEEMSDRSISFDIPERTTLESALVEWGMKARMTVMINTQTIANRATSHKIHGKLTARKALLLILQDSGLSYTEEGDRIRIVADGTLSPSALHGEPLDSAAITASDFEPLPNGSSGNEGPRTSGDNSGGSDASVDSSEGPTLEQVVVTAQKREQRLEDVPISISVLDAQTLVQSNQLTMVDYYMTIPGLSVAPLPQGGQNLGIRGITTNGTAGAQATATTGVLIDGTPIGTGNLYVPDLDPDDLQRIEVLRGPQGTLYGSSSMGGLINYITVDPSTEALTGRAEVGTSSVHNGTGLGYTARASVNIPLTSDLAVRANVFDREDPGYIDNPYTGIDGINEDHVSGGHVSVLWTPTDKLSVKLSALYQRLVAESTSDITTQNEFTGENLGDLQQVYARGSTPYTHREEDYSAVVKYQVGGLTISSNTGYNISDHKDSLDLSAALGSYGTSQFHVPTYTLAYHLRFTGYSEELRFSGPIGRYFDGLLGLYYNRSELNPADSNAWAPNPLTGVNVGFWGNFNASPPGQFQVFDETAVFADLTYHVFDQLDIQLGGRESRVRQFSSEEIITGPYETVLLGNPSPTSTFTPSAKESPFTFLVSPQYKLDHDTMIYARVASGFRPGAPNSPDVVALGAPAEIQPDKITSYELGLKGDVLEHTLSVDLSAYYIEWKDIQLELNFPHATVQYGANAGAAKSEGVDLSTHWLPAAGLNISGWVSYDDAEIKSYPTATAASFYAVPGDRLPYSAKISGNLSIDQQIPLGPSIMGFVGGAISYIGGREALFTSSPVRTYLPGYAKADLHAGLNYGLWKVTAYVNNVADRRGLISGGLGNAVEDSFYYITPRTVGLSIARSFK